MKKTSLLLKTIREQVGWSQQDLATYLERSLSAIYKYESDNEEFEPKIADLRKLKKLVKEKKLNIKIDDYI